jgi:hypothetical protein
MVANNKVTELYEVYKNLSFEKNVIAGSGSHTHQVATIIAMFGLLASIGIVAVVPNVWTWILFLAVLLTWFGLRIWVIKRIGKRLQEPDFQEFHGKSIYIVKLIFRLNYGPYYDAYLYRKVKEKVDQLQLNNSLDDLIAYFEEEGNQKHSFNWLPVTLVGAMLFPIWGEYVGFRYNYVLAQGINDHTISNGLGVAFELIPGAILWGLIIWGVYHFSAGLLLDDVKERKKLIRLLRMMKING